MKQIIKKNANYNTKNYIVLAVILITAPFLWQLLSASPTPFLQQSFTIQFLPISLLAITIFLIYLIVKQKNKPDFEVSETEIKNLKTNVITPLKDIEEFILTSVSKSLQLNTIMFRSTKKDKFTIVSLHHYAENSIDIFMQNYVPARSKEIVKQLQEGKTITFKQRSLAKFNNKVVTLTKTDLKIEEKTFQLANLFPVKTGNSIGSYELHNKQGETIFTFSDYTLDNTEVFRNVMNELVKN